MQPIDLPSTPADSRDYSLFRHDSGLHCLLISDPAASQATAVLQVDAGSHDEPLERPGLAHLLEHLLFMGSEAHPEPGSFARAIDHWGGRYNASTGPDSTAFFFSVVPAGLQPCLLQLADMLARPLFDPRLVEAERRVIDAEFHTRLGDDALHRQAVLGELFHPDHPLSRFTIGNSHTLAGEPAALSEELRSLHAKGYRLAAMSLVLHAPAAPEVLLAVASQAIESLANTPHGRQSPTARELPPLFPLSALPVCLRWRCLNGGTGWEVVVPLPRLDAEGTLGAARWLCEWLNDPAPSGALGWLRSRQLADQLDAQLEQFADRSALLLIRLQPIVSDAHAVLQALIDWFAGLAAHDPASFPLADRQRLAEFDFTQGPQGEPIAWCRRLAEHLLRYPAETVLTGPVRPGLLCATDWRALIETLQRGRWALAIGDPQMQSDRLCRHTLTPWTREIWPQLKGSTGMQVQLPSLPATSHGRVVPHSVELPGLRAGFIVGGQARVRLGWCLAWHVPADALHRQRLACEMAGEESSYWPAKGGVSLRWSVEPRILVLDAQGPEPLLMSCLNRFFARLHNPSPGAAAVVQRRWQRWQAQQRDTLPAYRLLDALGRYLGFDVDAGGSGQIGGLQEAQMICVHGGSRSPMAGLEQCLGRHYSRLALPFAWQRPVPRRLQPGEQLLEVPCRHADHARILYLQGSCSSAEGRALWRLIHQMIAAPFFEELRTRQQLGYWVAARHYPVAGMPGLLLLVQSPDQDQPRLAQAMESFLSERYRLLIDTPFAQIQKEAWQLALTLRSRADAAEARFELAWQQCLGSEEDDLNAEAAVLEKIRPEVWQRQLACTLRRAPRLVLQSIQDT